MLNNADQLAVAVFDMCLAEQLPKGRKILRPSARTCNLPVQQLLAELQAGNVPTMLRYNRRRRRKRKPQCSQTKEEKLKDRADLRVHIRANAVARIRAIGLSRVALNLGLITEQVSGLPHYNRLGVVLVKATSYLAITCTSFLQNLATVRTDQAAITVLLHQDLDTSLLMSSVQLRLQLSDSAVQCIADDSRPLTAPALEQHQQLRPAESTAAALAQQLMPAPPPRHSKRMAGIDSLVWRGKLVNGSTHCCTKAGILQ
jgi:hypothetical protein